MKPASPVKLEGDAERVRQNLDDRVTELQRLPAAGMRVLPSISLADGVPTPVPHGCTRRPQWIGASIVRGAAATGRIVETRDGSVDSNRYSLLTAIGYAATITVDLLVVP